MRAIDDSVDRLESVRRAPNKKHSQSVDLPSAAPAPTPSCPRGESKGKNYFSCWEVWFLSTKEINQGIKEHIKITHDKTNELNPPPISSAFSCV